MSNWNFYLHNQNQENTYYIDPVESSNIYIGSTVHNPFFQMANYSGNSSVPGTINAYGTYNHYQGTSTSFQHNNPTTVIDVGNGNIPIVSNLTPNAKEFKPSNSTNNNNINSVGDGAVRRNYNNTYIGENKKWRENGRSKNYGGTRRKYRNNYDAGSSRNIDKPKQVSGNDDGKSRDEQDSSKKDNENGEKRAPRKQSDNQYFANHQSNGYDNNYYSKSRQYEYYNSNYRKNNSRPEKETDFKRNYRKSTQNSYRNYNSKAADDCEKQQLNNSKTTKDVGDSKQSPVKYRNYSANIYDSKPNKFNNHRGLSKKLDSVSQRERLEELIVRCLLECLVCYEKLRHRDKVWSCKQCYHVVHLQCIIRWAESSKLESGWRCPACQNICPEVPGEYRCYCGKVLEPQLIGGNIPHSCNEVCGRKGRLCDHKCTLICHPGPCPDCNVMVTRSCNCGATTALVKCSSSAVVTCNSQCNKLLNCGIHTCTKVCHEGSCGPCAEKIKQECHCYKQCRKVACTAEVKGKEHYSCGDECGKDLDCGNHKCREICHEGDCKPCPKSPRQISTCPCGKTKLAVERKSCLDPIPCCDKLCGRTLKCGQPGKPHYCKEKCHEGDCPPCPLTTAVKCRCGNMDKEIPCAELKTRADDARCQKKCTKKRSCGKHRCNQFCCIDIEHLCLLPCNRTLTCGNHRCEDFCHKGRCPPCLRSSFEELYCECGSSVIFPPVPCGTKPPTCDQPCSRARPCGHEALHSCHTGPCPPCTVLTKTWCYGKHEQRGTIPCHQGEFSCGLPCGQLLPCGRHKCNHPCHKGPCPLPCKQPCMEPRSTCEHPCNLPCHDPPCPETPCRQMVKVACQCGHRSTSKACQELTGEYQSIAMSQLASKIEEIQRGEAVDLSDIVSGQKKGGGTFKVLECNDECRVIERNRRMAIALQVSNPEVQQKIVPKYSDYMRQWAKKNPHFCQYVHDKLTELVQLAKQSKQKSRSYSFETMNKEKRHFVHEYCEHFGCESAAYDPEPNRNVVATAIRDKCYLPSYSLLEVIQRESGQRKVPGPQQLQKGQPSASTSQTVSFKVTGRIPRPPTPPSEYVDYFDNPPEQFH